MATPSKVARRQAGVLRDADGLGLSASARRRLSAAQAMQVFSHRIGRELAAAVGLTEDEVHDWGNAERPRRGPHHKIVALTERALEEGIERRRALVLVDWIERELGRVAIDLPSADRELRLTDLPAGIREFGEVLRGMGEVLASSSPTADEIAAVAAELRDLIRWSQEALMRLARKQARGGRR